MRGILSRLKGLEQHVLDQAYVRLLTLASLRESSGVVEREARAMNFYIVLDDTASVHEHSQRKARNAIIDLVGDQIAAKFDMSPKAAKARLADFEDNEIKAVSLRLVDASTIGELLTG